MSEITFVVPGKAHGKERARTVLNQYGRAHTYTPDRQRNYEQIIKACYVAAAKGAASIEGAVELSICSVFEPPKSAKKSDKQMMLSGVLSPVVRPDLDNIVKSVLDALNRLAFKDDSQVVKISAVKVYGERARVIVRVGSIDEQERISIR